ncbi:MTC3-like protein [Saccharomyces kudriavzevii IFO 1802]|nr:YGL226W-like protein [Saccharomyces cerevisiae x Saccharomyces kudriavzevii VIN7]EJT42444.1 MTC3-like protein [Saccharomyces kudriavzevii IFO 1802]CAI5267734.1 AIS_HP2_G0017130.mRNA.1.CDS.1 [Saccharomyces cerevisiae]CAI6496604.1 AIS_HP2_G0017130.mRNA.1.CDS.1 [Saccharomyces cerevisiae]
MKQSIARLAVRRSLSTYQPPVVEITNIKKLWFTLRPEVRDEIKEYLRWRMQEDWRHIPLEEIKAAYFLSYGPCGGRSKNNQWNVGYTGMRMAFNLVLFGGAATAFYNRKQDRKLGEQLKNLV